jgi:molybdate transport system ATP-binding protein
MPRAAKLVSQKFLSIHPEPVEGFRAWKKNASTGSARTEKGKLDQTKLIELTQCSVVLDGKRALDEVSFALRRGERWAVFGANGAGKTLLLKLLRGDVWPTPSGREARLYYFDGDADPTPAGNKERIAYLGPEQQDKYVRYDWNHTVEQVVTTGFFDEDIPRTNASKAQRQLVVRLLRKFSIWSLRSRRFLTLSYGQRRRVLVARAIAGKPDVLLLDEVFNGLDAASARVLCRALEASRNLTWMIASHRLNELPHNVTHVARMAQGRITTAEPIVASDYLESEPIASGSRRHIVAPKNKTNAAPLVQLRGVYLYRDYRPVLSDVDWTLARGEHWAIVGRNGSGKSSFLKLLCGDLHPKLGGIIERDGVPFGTPISAWKARVGFVSPELQAEYFLARDLEEIVVSGRYASVGLNHPATAADRRIAKRWLKFFGLLDIAHRGPRALSYGQMRLALLARAMINEPELLLLDEPCTGLSPEMTSMLLGLLDRLAARGVQVVMAVHDRNDLPRCVRQVLEIGRDRKVTAVKREP